MGKKPRASLLSQCRASPRPDAGSVAPPNAICPLLAENVNPLRSLGGVTHDVSGSISLVSCGACKRRSTASLCQPAHRLAPFEKQSRSRLQLTMKSPPGVQRIAVTNSSQPWSSTAGRGVTPSSPWRVRTAHGHRRCRLRLTDSGDATRSWTARGSTVPSCSEININRRHTGDLSRYANRPTSGRDSGIARHKLPVRGCLRAAHHRCFVYHFQPTRTPVVIIDPVILPVSFAGLSANRCFNPPACFWVLAGMFARAPGDDISGKPGSDLVGDAYRGY